AKIARQILCENSSELLVVGLSVQCGLTFPFLWLEIRLALFECTVTECPCRRTRHHVDALEQSAILQNASTGNELAQSAIVNLPKLRANCENRLGFSCEVECILRLAVVETAHPVAIVEQESGSPVPIHDQTVESSIQARGKRVVFFVH